MLYNYKVCYGNLIIGSEAIVLNFSNIIKKFRSAHPEVAFVFLLSVISTSK
jgi:hypothetical protein